MRYALVSVLLISATSAAALPIAFTPPLPDSDDRIEVRFFGVCASVCSVEKATASVTGRVVTIAVTLQGSVLPSITPWEGTATIGPLAPGSYQVRVVVDETNFVGADRERELIVTEANPPFQVRPFAARRGETIAIMADSSRALARCTSSGCSPADFRINGFSFRDARATVPNVVHARVPDVPPGLYDVEVFFPSLQTRAVAAIRVFENLVSDDPSFERILVPTAFRGRGAFGSEWRTDVFARNTAIHRMPLFGIADVDSGSSVNVVERLPNDDRGTFLFVDRASARSLALAGFIRDVSHDGARWGVELPLVREEDFRRYVLDFAAVPMDRNARATLRIYALDTTNVDFAVIISGTANEILRQISVTASSPDETRPAYASLSLSSTGLEDQTATITIYPMSSSSESRFASFWAFVTVTNNDTQHVTIITPQ